MNGGAEGNRTPDLRIANATLSQLSYGPKSKTAQSVASEVLPVPHSRVALV